MSHHVSGALSEKLAVKILRVCPLLDLLGPIHINYSWLIREGTSAMRILNSCYTTLRHHQPDIALNSLKGLSVALKKEMRKQI